MVGGCSKGSLYEYIVHYECLKRTYVVRMHTVRLPMCSTVAPMARAGGGHITGNVLGQSFTSPSPCTHVMGAYGTPTGAVGGAANSRRREFLSTKRYQRVITTQPNLVAALSTSHRVRLPSLVMWLCPLGTLLMIKLRNGAFSPISHAFDRTTRATSQLYNCV